MVNHRTCICKLAPDIRKQSARKTLSIHAGRINKDTLTVLEWLLTDSIILLSLKRIESVAILQSTNQ